MDRKVDLKKIKLIIWDLDDTLWHGTLSEGEVHLPIERIELLKDLTDCGIINTICSKNSFEQAMDELRKLSIADYFVFNSIDWSPKGPRISILLKDLGLRAENVLFIDDNNHNLQDALFYEKNLMIATPDVIISLEEYVRRIPKKDIEHKRLMQYRILEEKQQSRKEYGSDSESFLFSTNTRVDIHTDCLSQIERIHELIIRTNQLNFTKNRCSLENLYSLLNDHSTSSAYVTAKDNFGDYGIVGFYAVKNNELIHFLFSCRTIGQGVEQFVYSYLGWPKLNVVGDVVSFVKRIPAPKWINQEIKTKGAGLKTKVSKGKILFKGPCDISGMLDYLHTDNVITELTHNGSVRHNYIEHHNHSVNYLQLLSLTEEDRKDWLSMIINDEDMFDTSLFDDDLDIVFLSTVLEPGLGIYRNKITGKLFAWGGNWDKPLTDKKYWDAYVNAQIFTGDNKFTYEFLSSFAEKYDFIGLQSPQEYIGNLRKLLSILPSETILCLLLGSEIPFENNKKSFLADRHIINKKYNDEIKRFAQGNTRIRIINFTDFIKSQDDYSDRITHFSRRVYYEAACAVNTIIDEKYGAQIIKSQIRLIFENMMKEVRKYTLNPMLSFLRRIKNASRKQVNFEA